jgi:hypothetical protein
MSVRSFHSVFMASAVAGAALGCYLVSLRVASERAALEEVESRIVQTQSDIRLLQTEVGTRSRLTQLERWNARALDLSAPSASQILGDKFQLASLVRPERRPEVEAPVVLATAPAPPPNQPLAQDSDPDVAAAPALLHTASLKVEPRDVPATADRPKALQKETVAATEMAPKKKAGEKPVEAPAKPVTRPVRTAKVDPLAPLPAGQPTAKGSRADR